MGVKWVNKEASEFPSQTTSYPTKRQGYIISAVTSIIVEGFHEILVRCCPLRPMLRNVICVAMDLCEKCDM